MTLCTPFAEPFCPMQLDPWAPLFAALLLLTVPLDWLAAALGAAAFHELCHILAIRALGGRVLGLRIGLTGAVIDAELPVGWREPVCALSGPAGSFLLLMLCRVAPKLALCGLVQGAFNLLPIYPMDGGRALAFLLHTYLPNRAKYIQKATQYTTIAAFYTLTACLCAKGILPSFLVFWMFLAFLFRIFRKIPCKPGQSRVQ